MKTSRRAGLPAPARWSLRVVALVAAVLALLSGGGANAAPLCWQKQYGYQNYKTQYLAQLPQTKPQYLISDPVYRTEFRVQPAVGWQWYDRVDWSSPVTEYHVRTVNYMLHENMFQPWNKYGHDWSGNYYDTCYYAFNQYDWYMNNGPCRKDHPRDPRDRYLCHLNDEVWNGWQWLPYLPPGHNEGQPTKDHCNNNPPDYWQAYTMQWDDTRTNWGYFTFWQNVPSGTKPADDAYHHYQVVGSYVNPVYGSWQWMRGLPAGRNGWDYQYIGQTQTVFDHWGPAYWSDTIPAGKAFWGQVQWVRTGNWQPATWIDQAALSGTNGTNAWVNNYNWDGRTTRQVPDGIDRYAPQVPAGTYPTGKTINLQVACEVRPT